MRRSLFAVLALASLLPTIALADNNDDCVEGDKDVDGPASRQRGRYPGAVQGLTPRALPLGGDSRAGFACSGLKRRLRCEITRP